ncbi:hypothetical protein [Butyricicoccus intestinisimiae]|uniref:Zinc-ribbon domain-containing protein n=1 Tax=Butyricicoccus intestinisimiae TaxID=2841509 RepID=A0ABS6EW34_9FIRM|nr:hypothetical protein [Butyricicoccus intestinisimiae]MBU5491321.1 hypothetical protein [Butyricicoccus intestinisimiae]
MNEKDIEAIGHAKKLLWSIAKWIKLKKDEFAKWRKWRSVRGYCLFEIEGEKIVFEPEWYIAKDAYGITEGYKCRRCGHFQTNNNKPCERCGR